MKKERSKKVCFVVGPIGHAGSPERTHSDWLLKGVLRPTFAAHFQDFDLLRADEISDPGLIDAQIIDHLLNAPLVIADLTTLNPNAFYEIGIRHLAQKPIIHMHLTGVRPPFDVSLFRSIEFAIAHPDDLEKACRAVESAVKAVLADGYEVENPVTRARGRVQFEASATPGELQMRQEIDRLSEAVESLQMIAVPGMARASDQRAGNTLTLLSTSPTVADLYTAMGEKHLTTFWDQVVDVFPVEQRVEYGPESWEIKFSRALSAAERAYLQELAEDGGIAVSFN